MKTMIAAALALVLSFQSNAQGVNQLWGLSDGDDPIIRGHLFSWDSATNTITNRKTFYSSVFSSVYPNFTIHNGMIYGVIIGDPGYTDPQIFEWDPQIPEAPGVIKAVINDALPNGNLVSWNDKLYGLTSTGGAADSGFLFEWDPASLTVVEKTSFDFTKGSKPLGGLVLLNDKLYGMTAKGGAYDLGVIFEWDPATNDFTKKIDFDGANGASPNGNLTWNGSLFYGVTDSGGVNNAGVLFSWDPATNDYLKKADFVAADGKNPCGTLVATGNKLYGMTTNGGANDLGTIFRWNTQAETFSKLIDLNSTEGGNPKGSMTLHNTQLYANTSLGIIEYDTVANTYLKKYDIGDGGNQPFNHPLLLDGKLYSTFGPLSFYASFGITVIDVAANTTKNYLTQDGGYGGATDYGAPGGLVEADGKLYGLTDDGGAERLGMIFRYDPSDYMQPYQPRYFFKREDGVYPVGNGNGLGGITSWGGWFDQGTAWGYIYTHNFVHVSRHFDDMTDPPPSGNPTPWGLMQGGKLIEDMQNGEWITHFDLGPGTGEPDLFRYNEKVYGVTDGGGGTHNMGYIFEWDPDEWSEEPQRFFKKLDFDGTNGASPNGTFTLMDGKFYGITRLGGANNQGTLYEWDPATNILTTLVHFDGTDKITTRFTAMNGKLYGMRDGGVNNKGMIFEFDPATGQMVNKAAFDGATNGKRTSNRLLVIPAGIARSAPGSCVGFPSVTIDETNNNQWVPVVDSHGDVLAEVKANGNNLGLLTVQSYVNAGPVRQDGQGHVYLDRNITISPAVQPAEGNPVDVRLYIPQSEFDVLLNTANAAIEDINDVAIFKGSENCDNNVQNATPLPTTAEVYAHGYILTASISSFSSFYFASSTFAVLPLQLLSFSGVVKNNDAQLDWQTTSEQNTWGFDVERSTDKNNFLTAGSVSANGNPGNHHYTFTDAGIHQLNASVIYYRIKMKDKDGRFTYSPTIALQVNTTATSVQFYPNPVSSRANLVITTDRTQPLQWRVLDNTGKTVGRNTLQVNKGVISLPVEVSHLPKGVYYLDVKTGNFSKLLKFVKQ